MSEPTDVPAGWTSKKSNHCMKNNVILVNEMSNIVASQAWDNDFTLNYVSDADTFQGMNNTKINNLQNNFGFYQYYLNKLCIFKTNLVLHFRNL